MYIHVLWESNNCEHTHTHAGLLRVGGENIDKNNNGVTCALPQFQQPSLLEKINLRFCRYSGLYRIQFLDRVQNCEAE